MVVIFRLIFFSFIFCFVFIIKQATDRDELLLTIRTMLAEEAIKDGAYDSALKYLTDLETPETAYQEAQVCHAVQLE